MEFLSKKKLIGQVLVEMGLINESELMSYIQKAQDESVTLGEYLIENDYVSEDEYAQALAKQNEIPFIDISRQIVDEEAVALITGEMARAFNILPLSLIGGKVTLAVPDPMKIKDASEIEQALDWPYDMVVAAPKQIESEIEKHYPAQALDSDEEVQKVLEKFKGSHTAQAEMKEQKETTSIEIIINRIIEDALISHTSDIHIEADDEELRVRKRIDGVLVVREKFPLQLHSPLVSRIKIMANLDIAEKRVAQDGRFQHRVMDRLIDFRASTLPTVKGEKVVLRILDKKNLKMNLLHLGMVESVLESLKECLNNPHGIILVTGPTGSGKTTTVYSMLNEINSVDRNIITVEDPVEYQFPLVNQVQVNAKIGLSFATVLRSILRQDPDTIMVGEIRDFETADIAIRAALTGHLVISTIHTNNSISTIFRLADIGIEPYLVSSSLLLVVAQRLIRTLCESCKEKIETLDQVKNIEEEAAFKEFGAIYRKKGCPKCFKTGFVGRTPVFEIFRPNAEAKLAIKDGASEEEILKIAKEASFRSLKDDVVDKMKMGLTNYDEVLRITGSVEEEGVAKKKAQQSSSNSEVA